MDEINIEDFLKIDFRVAKIISAENVEDADKLLKLNLDLGEVGKKTVFAGIKKFYEPCLLYTSPSPRDLSTSRMPSSA